jgi:hypothetical protein
MSLPDAKLDEIRDRLSAALEGIEDLTPHDVIGVLMLTAAKLAAEEGLPYLNFIGCADVSIRQAEAVMRQRQPR